MGPMVFTLLLEIVAVSAIMLPLILCELIFIGAQKMWAKMREPLGLMILWFENAMEVEE